MKSKKIKAALLTPALLFSTCSLLACGPWFPNNMLDRGDTAVLAAPVADFYRELERISLDAPKFRATPSTNSDAEETLQAEINDLRAALKKAGKSPDETEGIVTNHLAERGTLQNFADALTSWRAEAAGYHGEAPPDRPATQQPDFPAVMPVDGLPEEFADYFQGAIDWSRPAEADKAAARESWEKILNLPPIERHYKSTWAAFMLGRSWETDDPVKAGNYFKQVRDLAAHGFSDSADLAVASLGQEARLALETNDFQNAIELYLDQYAADGTGAGQSLQVAIGRALHAGSSALVPLALRPTTRRLVTAYLISRRTYDPPPSPAARENTRAWLEAVEKAEVTDVESAEQFALAAYQANDMALALRWINRAGPTPTAQWLKAKLFLRVGRVAQATELLSQIVDDFPLEQSTNVTAQTPLTDALAVPDANENEDIAAGRYIRGELGALRLSRREYIQALDLLLRANFWADAAYVADRVLTVEELKTYVDDNWPPVPTASDDKKTEVEKTDERLTSEIRYLLGRRLTRNNRAMEARAYFPLEWQTALDQLTQALNTGWDESIATNERAKSLAAAAFIARTNGMDLLGTEVAPDWHLDEGSFDWRFSTEARTNADAKAVFASKDELKRNQESKTDPNKRYHYRYQAAALAWAAAKLMPDNSDDTARLLCNAGSWLKAQDPIAADVFYKSLVRRCRKTAIGAEADEIRWFPQFDIDGDLIRTRLETLDLPTPQEINSAEPSADYPIPGKHFVAMAEDHVRYIAAAVRRLGVPMTEKEIFAANPDLTPNDNIAARDIFIPLPNAVSGETAQPNNGEEINPAEESQPVPVAPKDPMPPADAQEYLIQSDDSAARIAKQFGLTVGALLEANPGLDPRKLKVGQRILIPTPQN